MMWWDTLGVFFTDREVWWDIRNELGEQHGEPKLLDEERGGDLVLAQPLDLLLLLDNIFLVFPCHPSLSLRLDSKATPNDPVQ